MFVLLRGHDVWIYVNTVDYAQRDYLAHEIPMMMISTSLLAGVWFRQGWARYLLIAFLMARVAATSIFVPDYINLILTSGDYAVRLLSGPILMSGIAWALISLPQIRRLISRSYE